MGTLGAKASETQIAVDAIVDSICNAFESTWRSGHRARIEDFLERAPEADRERLLLELVLVEFSLRRSAGEAPSIDEYLERFPVNAARLKDCLLRQLETAGASPADLLDVEPQLLKQGDYWGRYQLLSLLGRGGFGEVWRARDPVLQRDVALKMLRSDKPISSRLNLDLVREGQRVAQLDHEHIVRVLHAEIVNGRACLVSDLKEGGTLQSRLKDGSVIDRETAVQWMIDVAQALQSAHERGIIHRDLKPGNLLFDNKGNIFVADFGLAISELEQLYEPAAMMGTWAYASPEQVRGESRLADPRSDLYSFGVILFQLLTGRLPFKGDTVEQYKQQILEREPRPLRAINADIPIELETICLACLRKEIANRPASAQEVAERLEAWLKAQNASAITLQPRHKPGVQWLAMVLIILIAVAAVVIAPRLMKQPEPGTGDWTNPRVRVWNASDAEVDFHGYEADAGRYRFASHGESFFEVGQCSGDSLRLEATLNIHDFGNLGRAGVFWGYGPVSGSPGVSSCCWGITVGKLNDGDADTLHVRQYDIGPGAVGGGHYARELADINTIALVAPLAKRFILRVEVTANQVTEIYLDGKPLLSEPLTLQSELMRHWQVLDKMGYGYMGKGGTFSVESFSAE